MYVYTVYTTFVSLAGVLHQVLYIISPRFPLSIGIILFVSLCPHVLLAGTVWMDPFIWPCSYVHAHLILHVLWSRSFCFVCMVLLIWPYLYAHVSVSLFVWSPLFDPFRMVMFKNKRRKNPLKKVKHIKIQPKNDIQLYSNVPYTSSQCPI